jgi:SAM-dependent methyltransferase
MTGLSGFPRSMLPLLRCLLDGDELRVEKETLGNKMVIADGILRCVKCSCDYRIESGIVRLMAKTLTQESEHEIGLKDHEYEAMPDIFSSPTEGWRSEFSDGVEIPPHLSAIGNVYDRRVLELGCGDGRFTILMAQLGAEVLAMDFSFAALRKVRSRLQTGVAPTTYTVKRSRFADDLTTRVGLVQADASNFQAAQFPQGAFGNPSRLTR